MGRVNYWHVFIYCEDCWYNNCMFKGYKHVFLLHLNSLLWSAAMEITCSFRKKTLKGLSSVLLFRNN